MLLKSTGEPGWASELVASREMRAMSSSRPADARRRSELAELCLGDVAVLDPEAPTQCLLMEGFSGVGVGEPESERASDVLGLTGGLCARFRRDGAQKLKVSSNIEFRRLRALADHDS